MNSVFELVNKTLTSVSNFQMLNQYYSNCFRLATLGNLNLKFVLYTGKKCLIWNLNN